MSRLAAAARPAGDRLVMWVCRTPNKQPAPSQDRPMAVTHTAGPRSPPHRRPSAGGGGGVCWRRTQVLARTSHRLVTSLGARSSRKTPVVVKPPVRYPLPIDTTHRSSPNYQCHRPVFRQLR